MNGELGELQQKFTHAYTMNGRWQRRWMVTMMTTTSLELSLYRNTFHCTVVYMVFLYECTLYNIVYMLNYGTRNLFSTMYKYHIYIYISVCVAEDFFSYYIFYFLIPSDVVEKKIKIFCRKSVSPPSARTPLRLVAQTLGHSTHVNTRNYCNK